jgi:hypothetical protein
MNSNDILHCGSLFRDQTSPMGVVVLFLPLYILNFGLGMEIRETRVLREDVRLY